MTPATENKARAIRVAMDMDQRFNRPDLVSLLAMLTSQDKTERESAKNIVRQLHQQGAENSNPDTQKIKANKVAIELGDFANRFEID